MKVSDSKRNAEVFKFSGDLISVSLQQKLEHHVWSFHCFNCGLGKILAVFFHLIWRFGWSSRRRGDSMPTTAESWIPAAGEQNCWAADSSKWTGSFKRSHVVCISALYRSYLTMSRDSYTDSWLVAPCQKLTSHRSKNKSIILLQELEEHCPQSNLLQVYR